MKTKLIVAQVAAANVVPPDVNTKEFPGIINVEAQKNKIPWYEFLKQLRKVQLTKDQLKKLFDKIDSEWYEMTGVRKIKKMCENW